jgi:hypothetical protein
MIPLLVAWLIATAPAPQLFWGLMCFSEGPAQLLAQVYNDSGQQLEDEVADDLVTQKLCVIVPEEAHLTGYIVYEGAIIGTKHVIGLAPNREGPPQLYGIEFVHLPQDDEA